MPHAPTVITSEYPAFISVVGGRYRGVRSANPRGIVFANDNSYAVGGALYGDAGTDEAPLPTVPWDLANSTQADSVILAAVSGYGLVGEALIGSGTISGGFAIRERAVCDTGLGHDLSTALGDAVVSATGSFRFRVDEWSDFHAVDFHCEIHKAAVVGVPVTVKERVAVCSDGMVTELEVPWEEEHEVGDFHWLRIEFDYGLDEGPPSDEVPTASIECGIDNYAERWGSGYTAPPFDGPIQFVGVSASMFLSEVPPDPPVPPDVIGVSPGLLEAVGTPGHVIIGPSGASL